MSADVIRLVPNEVGEEYRRAADDVLKGAMKKRFTNLVIIGEVEGEDDLYIAGMANAGESIIMMELAKMDLIGR